MTEHKSLTAKHHWRYLGASGLSRSAGWWFGLVYGVWWGCVNALTANALRAAVFVIAVFLLAGSPASAAAGAPELLWQTPGDAAIGSGAGRLDHPEAVAADRRTGNLFVQDNGNFRIDELAPWGEFLQAWGWGVADGKAELQSCGPGAQPPTATCQRGIRGSSPGQFGVMAGGVAVDSAGDVYVGDLFNHRVEKFDSAGKFLLMFGGGVDAGPHHPGDVCSSAYIAEGDSCGAGVVGAGAGEFTTEEFGQAAAYVAVSATGTVLVGDHGRIQEFEADGAFKSQIELEGEYATKAVKGLTTDPAGNLYITLAKRELKGGAPGPYILEMDPSGGIINTFTLGIGEWPNAITVDANENLYVAVESQGGITYHEIIEFGPNHAPVLPVGSRFDFSEGIPDNGVPLIAGIASNTVDSGGGVDLYVTATDVNERSFVSAFGPPPLNWPPPHIAPEIRSQYALSVEVNGAALGAQINPRFWADTSYYVEYGLGRCSQGECTSRAPALAGTELGAGEAGAAVAIKPVRLAGLSPRTTYHYRFVAASSGGGPTYGVGAAESEASFTTVAPAPEPDRSCTNQQLRTGPSAALPDCRAYEMVSPVEKNNVDIATLINVNNDQVALDQAATSGGALTYTTSQGFGDAQGVPYSSQYIASRGADGWTSDDITPPQGLSTISIGHRIDLEFRDFTEDLCSSVVTNPMIPVLAPGAVEGYFNLYRRQDCGSQGYEALTTAPPLAGTEAVFYEPTVQGTSNDGSCTVFQAKSPLTPQAAAGKMSQLYESCRGTLYLLSLLPNGKADTLGASAGTYDGDLPPRAGTVARSVSADGSRIYWTAGEGFGAEALGKLYVRENSTQEPSRIVAGRCTEPEKACTVAISSEPSQFWSASPDGVKALYNSLGELYESTLEGNKATSKPIAAKVTGVVGAGEDASQVYFVSEESLTGANGDGISPVPGKPNLYYFDATKSGPDRYRFIGELSVADAQPRTRSSLSPVNIESYKKTSRVSSDGLHAAFMSNSSLTGYDNVDSQSGQLDEEVYLYDAGADGGQGRLHCVSCNPTGQRPTGHQILLEGFESGWTAALLPPYETELYAPRALSDGGTRVFFDSYESLVSRDTNGTDDVYEWEAPGAGDCGEDAVYSVRDDGGCLSLISSGESSTNSEFIDASPSGADVFFATASSLVTQDPGLIDIYDARVGGGFPAPPTQRAGCEGEACQGAPSPPQDTSPASASFTGPPNPVSLVTERALSKRKTSSQSQKKRLARALKACARKKVKSARRRCQALARKRFATKARSKPKTTSMGGR